MANNRMYLCHRPSGLAVYLGKRMAWGWYDAADDLGMKVQALYQAVERDGDPDQDDFCLVFDLDPERIEFTLITDGSGKLRPEYQPVPQPIVDATLFGAKYGISQEGVKKLAGFREIEIWSEGFAATGQAGPATFVGRIMANSLREACDIFAADNPNWAHDYDSEKLTHWGCRLFDNEADARKAFG